MPETPTQKVAKVIMAIYENTQKLTRLSKKLLLSKNTLEAEDLDEIKEILNKLTEARETALQVGKRGHGNLWLIKQLKRFANNLIKIKSVGKKEINRFSGAISFFSFIIILFFVNLFFQPDQALGLGYFFGSLIVSLIIGYGFGAIKFIPLLKTYRDVLSDIKQ